MKSKQIDVINKRDNTITKVPNCKTFTNPINHQKIDMPLICKSLGESIEPSGIIVEKSGNTLLLFKKIKK